MRLIFLDVDGVLITKAGSVFCQDALHNLAHLVKEVDAKIVISSSWRLFQDMRDDLINHLKEVEIDDRVIGDTPDIFNPNKSVVGNRGVEINAWLEDNTDTLGSFMAVIFDDDEDAAQASNENANVLFVQTHWGSGLNQESVQRAREFLR